jgi:hypothetical protein
MKKSILLSIYFCTICVLNAQSVSLEVGNMYCNTNTGSQNPYVKKSVFQNKYYHLDFSIEKKNNYIYMFGYTFYQPFIGLRFVPVPDETATFQRKSIVNSHHLSFGLGYRFKIWKEIISVSPSFHLDGRINIGDIGAVVATTNVFDKRSYTMDIVSRSGFHIVPNIKTKISIKLNDNYSIFGSLGYMYSFNKSIKMKYDVYDVSIPDRYIYSGTGYFTGTNWNYGIGLSFNPRILTK